MIAFAKRLWSAAPLATAILALALTASAVFGVRAALLWHDRYDRFAREAPLAPWMTPRFIAHSWHVPPEVILEALDAPMPPPKGPINLEELAALNGTTVEAVIAAAEAAIADWRATEGKDQRRPGAPDGDKDMPPDPDPEGGAQ